MNCTLSLDKYVRTSIISGQISQKIKEINDNWKNKHSILRYNNQKCKLMIERSRLLNITSSTSITYASSEIKGTIKRIWSVTWGTWQKVVPYKDCKNELI